jgi:hypothetical protein
MELELARDSARWVRQGKLDEQEIHGKTLLA